MKQFTLLISRFLFARRDSVSNQRPNDSCLVGSKSQHPHLFDVKQKKKNKTHAQA